MTEYLSLAKHRRKLLILLLRKLAAKPKSPSYLVDENHNIIVIGEDRILLKRLKGM